MTDKRMEMSVGLHRLLVNLLFFPQVFIIQFLFPFGFNTPLLAAFIILIYFDTP